MMAEEEGPMMQQEVMLVQAKRTDLQVGQVRRTDLDRNNEKTLYQKRKTKEPRRKIGGPEPHA